VLMRSTYWVYTWVLSMSTNFLFLYDILQIFMLLRTAHPSNITAVWGKACGKGARLLQARVRSVLPYSIRLVWTITVAGLLQKGRDILCTLPMVSCLSFLSRTPLLYIVFWCHQLTTHSTHWLSANRTLLVSGLQRCRIDSGARLMRLKR
jgi:hypothetical protein